MTPNINFLAVLAAAVVSIVLGFLWYGPFFGKPWMKLMGIDPKSIDKEKMKGMGKTYALMTLTTLIMAYVMAHSLIFASTYTQTYGVMAGLTAAFWNWLGFMLPILMGDQLWGGKSWKLLPITSGYYLVSLSLMGIILASWK